MKKTHYLALISIRIKGDNKSMPTQEYFTNSKKANDMWKFLENNKGEIDSAEFIDMNKNLTIWPNK